MSSSTCVSSILDPSLKEFVAVFFSQLEKLRIHPKVDYFSTKGREYVITKLVYCYENSLPLELILPAFPFKSQNIQGKVLSKLPDRGEELALQVLENFCCQVEKVYPLDVRVILFSDGKVFHDLFNKSFQEIDAYNDSLQELMDIHGYTHLQFDGLENYTFDADIHELFYRYDLTHVDIPHLIKTKSDVRLTYCGFLMFLEKEMAMFSYPSKHQKFKVIRKMAKQMIHRNMAFSRLSNEQYPHAIRLSIHAHDNSTNKIGIHVLPTTTPSVPKTPWQNVIVESRKGSIEAMHLDQVDRTKYDLYYKYGRKWGFREKAKVLETRDKK